MLGELDPVGGGDPIPLLKEKLLIGRRSHCDITLHFQNVSSHHCELEYKDGYWMIRDLGSRNGIKVNDLRCQQKFLMPDDKVSIAKNEYRIRYEPGSTEAPPELEEEDIMAMSLLEKAGLVSRRTERERPVSPPPLIEPPSKIETDEDQALHWLADDDD